jgi:hypothetical protein
MITEERLKEIGALFQNVAMQGEFLYGEGTPWPPVVGEQHTAIWELMREVRRLQQLVPTKGRHSA